MALFDTYELKLASWMDGQLGLNVTHWTTVAETGSGASRQQMANDMFLALWPTLVPLMADDAVVLGASIRRMYQTPEEVAVASNTAEQAGTVISDPIPSQACGLITLRSAFAGRANRGRTYVPFPPASRIDATSGLPDATYLADAAAYATALTTVQPTGLVGNTTDLALCITHGSVNNILLTSFAVRTAWATQKRRGSLGKPNPRAIPL